MVTSLVQGEVSLWNLMRCVAVYQVWSWPRGTASKNLFPKSWLNILLDFRVRLPAERDLCFWSQNGSHYLTKRLMKVSVTETSTFNLWRSEFGPLQPCCDCQLRRPARLIPKLCVWIIYTKTWIEGPGLKNTEIFFNVLHFSYSTLFNSSLGEGSVHYNMFNTAWIIKQYSILSAQIKL